MKTKHLIKDFLIAFAVIISMLITAFLSFLYAPLMFGAESGLAAFFGTISIELMGLLFYASKD